MVVYVDEARCTGCGECVRACPKGAITLETGVAHIEGDRCTACGACIEVCPQGAILSVTEPGLDESDRLTRQPPAATAVVAPPHELPAMRKFVPWAGVALAFAGREIVPRVLRSLLDAWDARHARRSEESRQAGVMDCSDRETPAEPKSSPGRHRERHGRR